MITRFGIGRVDVLAVDTERYDFEIIKMFDFDRMKPGLVGYENIHLTASDAEACTQFLEGHGYRIFKKNANTVALRTTRSNALLLRLTLA